MTIAGFGEIVHLEIPRVPPVVVLATPHWADGGPAVIGEETLAPAGAVWPMSLTESGELSLDFRHGPVASLTARAIEAGIDVTRLNIHRLRDEIAARIDSDPWLLDMEAALEALQKHRMRVTAVRPVEVFPTGLVLPPGVWYAASPFATVSEVPLQVPQGSTAFYSNDRRRALIVVDVNRRAWMTVSESPH